MGEDRLQQIETILAHQEQQIRDLSEMVDIQRREIAALGLQIAHLNKKLNVLAVEPPAESGRDALSVAEQAALDKPPHY